MKKIMKFLLILLCVFHLAGCSNQPKIDYDRVQMSLVLSSTTAGQLNQIDDEKTINELWTLCQGIENQEGSGQQWEITFINQQSNEKKTYRIFESQEEIYEDVTKIYNQHFK